MRTPRTSFPAVLTVALTAVAGLALSLGSAPTAGASASTPPAVARPDGTQRVATRSVTFDLVNSNDTSVACVPDNRGHQVRGRLVGPRRDVRGYGPATRINVLVHDAGTGAWFWNQRRTPAYDYATQLAKRGETSLVLDRLGYGRSPLADGDDTCLGAQAFMLHQVVQHLYAGKFEARGRGSVPQAGSVVVHGHGTGGAIAQIEAATYDDTAGLVLMSWSGRNASRTAIDEARRQGAVCAGRSYASYGASAAAFRRLLFVSAPAKVQRLAAQRRNATPCGDVESLPSATAVASSSADRVEVPVLLMYGSEDRRMRAGTARDNARSFGGSESVSLAVLRGAGSALPLERSAKRTRGTVLRWLNRL